MGLLPKAMLSPWIRILYRFDHGEDIYKEDVLDALESDYPVPYNAKPLLAAIVSGKYKSSKYILKKGTARNRKLQRPAVRLQLVEQFEYLEHLIENPDADLSGNDADAVEWIELMREEAQSDLKGMRTARTLAKEVIAKTYRISVRKVEEIIREYAAE